MLPHRSPFLNIKLKHIQSPAEDSKYPLKSMVQSLGGRTEFHEFILLSYRLWSSTTCSPLPSGPHTNFFPQQHGKEDGSILENDTSQKRDIKKGKHFHLPTMILLSCSDPNSYNCY
jgi:hypothetical protein